MDQVCSYGFENLNITSGFYSSRPDLKKFSKKALVSKNTIFDTEFEFDSLSDASLDTPSSFSFDSVEYLNYAIQEKKSLYFGPESLVESQMKYGRGAFTHPESLHSSLWSDDEMGEFLPFEEITRPSLNTRVDEEAEKWLADLAHQDMMTADLSCYSAGLKDPHIKFRRTLNNIPVNIIPTQTSALYRLMENIRPNNVGALKEDGLLNLYRDNTSVKNNPNTNHMLPNPNSRESDTEGSGQENRNTIVKSTETQKAEKECPQNSPLKKKAKKKADRSTGNDAQRVFLGGLPIGITERMLREHLAALGYKVLKRPKIMHGFAPEVWMKTVDQAKDLISKGVITIDGLQVEVRPYNSLTKLSVLKKLPNVGRRSVFIGGLPVGTTTKNLLDVLVEIGMKVINYPVIKHGFARQVILDTISQAQSLIIMKKLKVKGAFADIRPFVNQKRRRRTR